MDDPLLSASAILERDNIMVDKAKESITKIEETTLRIKDIVAGSAPACSARSHVRRRSDRHSNVVRYLTLLATLALLPFAVCVTVFICYTYQTETAVTVLNAKIDRLELEIKQLSTVQSSHNSTTLQ